MQNLQYLNILILFSNSKMVMLEKKEKKGEWNRLTA